MGIVGRTPRITRSGPEGFTHRKKKKTERPASRQTQNKKKKKNCLSKDDEEVKDSVLKLGNHTADQSHKTCCQKILKLITKITKREGGGSRGKKSERLKPSGGGKNADSQRVASSAEP